MKAVYVIFILLASIAAQAKHEPKDYPLTGTVTGFRTASRVSGHVEDGTGNVGTDERRVYTVKTDTQTLSISGSDYFIKAYTRPVLSVGQKLEFRTNGKFIWTVLVGKEHRYAIEGSE